MKQNEILRDIFHRQRDLELTEVVTTLQLSTAGLDSHEIERLVRGGVLCRVERGFYTLGPPSWMARLQTGFARVGRAIVSHRSAARLRVLREDDDIDLTLRYPANSRVRGVQVHRSRDIEDVDVEIVAGLPTTSVQRTLCDLGLVLPPVEVERTIDHAMAMGLLSPTELSRLREQLGKQGRNGVGAVDMAMEGMPSQPGRADSGPEVRLLKAIRRTTLPEPVPQYSIVAAGRQYYIDLAYPDFKIALEYDGAEFHSTPAQRKRDARRQAAIESEGWLFLRYTLVDLQLANIPQTVATIRDAIWLREAS